MATRDDALKAILEVLTRALQSLDARLEVLESRTESLTLAHKAHHDQTAAEVEEKKMSLRRIFLRTLNQASQSNPLSTLSLMGMSLCMGAFTILGGLYALIWHEPPAAILTDLFALIPSIQLSTGASP